MDVSATDDVEEKVGVRREAGRGRDIGGESSVFEVRYGRDSWG